MAMISNLKYVNISEGTSMCVYAHICTGSDSYIHKGHTLNSGFVSSRFLVEGKFLAA